jgi:deoxyribonuclease V
MGTALEECRAPPVPVTFTPRGWPSNEDELVAEQHILAEAWAAELAERPLLIPPQPLIVGCYVAFARPEGVPATPGNRAWAAAVAWRASETRSVRRSSDRLLKGVVQGDVPRQPPDVASQVVVTDRVTAPYIPGLLALREGPALSAALDALLAREVRPDVVLVDATGRDHPRRAGLGLHFGAMFDLPSVGVTHRPLVGQGDPPGPARGSWSPVWLGGEEVGRWLRTRSGTKPVLAHAAWRSDAAIATELAHLASSEGARTPIPLQEARRVAHEARALATGADRRLCL